MKILKNKFRTGTLILLGIFALGGGASFAQGSSHYFSLKEEESSIQISAHNRDGSIDTSYEGLLNIKTIPPIKTLEGKLYFNKYEEGVKYFVKPTVSVPTQIIMVDEKMAYGQSVIYPTVEAEVLVEDDFSSEENIDSLEPDVDFIDELSEDFWEEPETTPSLGLEDESFNTDIVEIEFEEDLELNFDDLENQAKEEFLTNEEPVFLESEELSFQEPVKPSSGSDIEHLEEFFRNSAEKEIFENELMVLANEEELDLFSIGEREEEPILDSPEENLIEENLFLEEFPPMVLPSSEDVLNDFGNSTDREETVSLFAPEETEEILSPAIVRADLGDVVPAKEDLTQESLDQKSTEDSEDDSYFWLKICIKILYIFVIIFFLISYARFLRNLAQNDSKNKSPKKGKSKSKKK